MRRRWFLGLAAAAPLALWAVGSVAADTVCADPEALSDAELSLRVSLAFKAVSADPAKRCAGCAFFKADPAAPTCGACAILHGPVASVSFCRSWAGK